MSVLAKNKLKELHSVALSFTKLKLPQ